MRRSKEIIVLLALLAGAMAFVLWYVIDRRAKNRAPHPPATTGSLAPEPLLASKTPAATPPVAETVDLANHDRQTVDYSSGKPVVKDSAEDRAAIDAALKDIAEATKGVTFDPPPKPAEPAAGK
jgi:hypothetical protein